MGFLLPQWLKDFIFQFLDFFMQIIVKTVPAVKPIFADILSAFFNGCLTVVGALLSAIDLGPLMVSVTGVWTGLDPSVAWMINATGVPQGLAMMSIAYTIRMGLNLIPGTLTRI